MGLFNLKDGKLVKNEEKPTEAPTAEAPSVEQPKQVEPVVAEKTPAPKLVKEPEEPIFNIVVERYDAKSVQFQVLESELKGELAYLESQYLDDNIDLMMVGANAVIVKDSVSGWFFNKVDDYEAGEDAQD